MSTHMTKTWFDGEQIVTQEIPEEKIYLQGEEHMTCPDCERHKQRAALWRAEAYKQAGHEFERPWVGLTDDDIAQAMFRADAIITGPMQFRFAGEVEAALRSKNGG